MSKFLFSVFVLYSVFSTAADVYSEREHKFLDSGDVIKIDSNGRPQMGCEDRNKMLAKLDCLRADGKLAKFCMVKELNKNENYQDGNLSCGKEWSIDYVCRDFVICSSKEEGMIDKGRNKKPSHREGVK